MGTSEKEIIGLVLLLSAGCVYLMAASGCRQYPTTHEGLRTAPLIRGTLWWIPPEKTKDQWQKEYLAGEIQAQIDVGFDLLWIFNTPNFVQEAIKTQAEGKSHDMLEVVYEIADKKGMHVIVDLPKASWHGETTPENMIAENKKHIQLFFDRYGHHPSFYGWYLNYEINPIRPSEKDLSAFWRKAWKGIVSECHRVAPGSVVTISPFFLLDKDSLRGFTYLEPELYEQWWGVTLAETKIDILMLQDSGEHLRFFTLEEREPFFAAFARACQRAGTRFWLNVETGQEDVGTWDEYFENQKRRKEMWDYWQFTPMEQLEGKLHLAARYGANIINWGYYPFMSPHSLTDEELDGQQAAYDAYKAYYERTINRDEVPVLAPLRARTPPGDGH